MSTEVSLEGGCLCGSVRYRSLSKPVFVSHCHCQNCRRNSGALFMTHLGLPVEGFTWLRERPKYWRSSEAFERGHCVECGSTVAARYFKEPELNVIPAGTLDDPDLIRADRHIMTESQVCWLKIEDDLPRFPRISTQFNHLDVGL